MGMNHREWEGMGWKESFPLISTPDYSRGPKIRYNVVTYMCVETYFVFVICLCVFATIVTMAILNLYLRAENKPVAAMPAWVSRYCKAILGTHIILIQLSIVIGSSSSSLLPSFKHHNIGSHSILEEN